nr:hypothetical protein B0A51_15784 [Rachicladosporium sp. CCFEE 5018]
MVSFSCEACGDVLTKKKLDPHRNQCRGASYTCLDCMVHFHGTEYRSHTACISEAQKYQGALYREKKSKRGQNTPQHSQSQEVMRYPPGAYVEDAVDDGGESQAVAVLNVPPRAPTPPPAADERGLEGVNVFDFLVTEAAPVAVDESRMIGAESQYSQYSNGNGTQYLQHGFSYGDSPVNPTFERYDSMQNMLESQQSALMPPPFVTPGPKKERREKEGKSDKKRKRQQVDDLDLSASKRPSSRGNEMSDAPGSGQRMLHSGLTGGLSKLVTDGSFYEDRIDAGPTPISPVKRSKREKSERDVRKEEKEKRKSSHSTTDTTSKPRSEVSSTTRQDRESQLYNDDRHASHRRHHSPSSTASPDRSISRASKSKPSKAVVEFAPRPQSVQPTSSNQVGHHFTSKAELFMSFVNKGPDSERGLSINKALKRFHREVGASRDGEKEDEDKELWKNLRVRRNDRGEVVLFVA